MCWVRVDWGLRELSKQEILLKYQVFGSGSDLDFMAETPTCPEKTLGQMG